MGENTAYSISKDREFNIIWLQGEDILNLCASLNIFALNEKRKISRVSVSFVCIWPGVHVTLLNEQCDVD